MEVWMSRSDKKSGGRFRTILSRTLIIIGSLAIAISLGYELIEYPWATLFSPDSPQVDNLPPPARLNVPVKTYDELLLSKNTPTAAPALPEVDSIIGAASSEKNANSNEERAEYLIGEFKIPKLSVSENLLEGGEEQMMHGVGHISGTALPGAAGNCAISGHRNYIVKHPFKHLDKLSPGDKVFIYADNSEFGYTVYDSFEVEPTDVWVLKPVQGKLRTLTLITCTPFINPTRRLIVRCELTEVNGKTPAPSALRTAVRMRQPD